MKKALLLLFSAILFVVSNVNAQRIIWSEDAGNRIRSGNLTPTTVTSPADFITGLNFPGTVEVDQINNVLYYSNWGGEDILTANLTTGTPISTLISTGAMAGFYDFSFSDNAGAVFGAAIDEVEGVYVIPANGDPDWQLDLGPYSNDVFSSVVADDDNEYVYLGHAYNGWIYQTGISGGSIQQLAMVNKAVDMSYDRFNNDLYIIDEASGYDLYRLDLDGGSLELLFSLGSTTVNAIQVYPQFGKVYFSRSNMGIYAANMDGSGSPTQVLNLSGAGSIHFDIVEDWTSPVFTALAPANGAVDISTTPTLSITFNENVKVSPTAGAGNDVSIRIMRYSDNAVIQTLDRSAANIMIVNNVVTIAGIDMLDPEEDYYVLIGNRVISDLSGNNFIGISTNAGWRFRTVSGVLITVAVSDACVGTYSNVGDITITETHATNFKTGVNQTLTFTISGPGYTFNPGVGSVSHTAGRNITASAINVTATGITLTYSVSSESLSDVITISGLQITSDNAANADVNVVRSGGGGRVDRLPLNTSIATIGTQTTPSAPGLTYPAGQVFCIDSDVSGVLVNAVGSELKWYSDAGLTNEIAVLNDAVTATGPDLAISSATSQVFSRYVTQTQAGCESLPSVATITIDPGPQAISTDFTPNTICDGTPNGAAHVTDVNSSGLADYTVNWYDNALIPLGATGPSLVNVPPGAYNALVTSTTTGCSNYAGVVNVPNAIVMPVVQASSTPHTHCENPDGSASAWVQSPEGPPTDYVYTWYDGPDTGGDVLPATGADLSGVPAGTYTLVTRYLPTGCVSTPSLINVDDGRVFPTVTQPSGEVCESSFESGSANVDLTTLDGSITGGNPDWGVTWFDQSSNPVTAATVTSGNQFTFVVSSFSTGCESSGTLDFTVFTRPTPAAAGADKEVCGATTVLEGNMPVYGIGSWSVISGSGGAIASPSDYNSGFTGIPGNTYELQWQTYHVPQCPVSTSTVTIMLTAPPTVSDAGTEQLVCDGPAALTANTPITGSGEWSIVSGAGGTFDDISDPATSFTGVAGESYELRWTISNGSCPPSSSDVTIKVVPPPSAAAAGNDIADCGNAADLNANTPVIGTGSWSVIAGTGGSFSSVSDPATTFSGISGTTYTLRWTIASPGCMPATDDVVVQFVAEPSVAIAGSDQEVCGSAASLLAATPTVGTGTWTVVSGSGGTFADAGLANTTFTGAAGTTYVLRWSVSTGSECPQSTDDVTIALAAPPTVATAGSDATVCDAAVSLAANVPVTGTGQWSVVTGAEGSFANAANATTSFTGNANETYQLRWTISNGVCPASSDDVTINLISPPTTAQAGSDQTACSSSVALAANTPASGTGSWSVVSGPGGAFTSTNNPATGFTGIPGNTYTLRWTISQGGCTPSFDEVSVALQSIPLGSGVITGVDQLCQGESASFSVSGITGADEFNWTVPSGIITDSNTGQVITITAGAGSGGNITVTPSNNCGNGTPVIMALVVLPSPEVSITLPPSPFPEDPVTFAFTSSTPPQNLVWDFGEGGSSSEEQPVYAYGMGGEYAVSLTVTGPNGCEGSDSKTLTVKTEPELDDSAIKNVITANGDDKNRYLHIVNLDRYPGNLVRFLDRWGVEVFSAINYENNWDARGRDGQYLPAGQYICIVKFPETGKVISRTVSIIKGR